MSRQFNKTIPTYTLLRLFKAGEGVRTICNVQMLSFRSDCPTRGDDTYRIWAIFVFNVQHRVLQILS